MKKILTIKLLVATFSFMQIVAYAQNKKVKIYQSKSSEACLVVFPNSPEPLMVMTGAEGCTVVKTMAADDWTEMSSSTIVSTSISAPKPAMEAATGAIKSPRDAASGLATGKRQHKPIRLSDFTLDALPPDADSDGDGIEIYSFSWGMSNPGAMSSGSSAASGRKAGYNVKENVKRTVSPSSSSCCSEGMCTITVSVDKKHTKSGHVTLLK